MYNWEMTTSFSADYAILLAAISHKTKHFTDNFRIYTLSTNLNLLFVVSVVCCW